MAKISGLTQETSFADDDNFVFSDSSAGLDKRISGEDLQKRDSAFAVDNVAGLIALDGSDFATGDKVERLGFYAAGDSERVTLYWDASEDKANHDGWSVIDPSHTATIGADAWYSSENTGSGCWKLPLGDRYTLAQAGGKASDTGYNATLALDNMKAALSAGDTIIVDDDYYFAPTFTLDKRLNIRGGGSLIVNNSGDYDQAVIISADRADFRVAVDQSAITTHSGRGEAIRVTGNHVYVLADGDGERSVRGIVDLSNYLYVSGHDFRVDGEVRNAAYSSLRQNSAERLHIGTFRSIDYGEKGYVYNGAATGSVFVDDYYASSDTTDSGAVGFLVDPDPNYIGNVYVNKIEIDGGGGTGGSSIKLDFVERFYANSLVFKNDLNANSSLIVADVRKGYVNEIIVDSAEKIFIGEDTGKFIIDSIKIDSSISDSIRIDADDTVRINNLDIKGSTSRGIRLEDTAAGGNQRLIIEDYTFEGAASDDLAIGAIGGTYTGQITILEYEIITGNAELTGLSNNNAAIKRAMTSPRVFKHDNDPASDSLTFAYVVGDRIYNSSPSAGGFIGWVCTTAGSPGTWKGFGSIEA